MKNRRMFWAVFCVILGLLLSVGGLAAVFLLPDTTEGLLRTLPYIAVGVGAGLAGGGGSAILSRRILAKNPDLVKQMNIETRDERNIAISNKAKAGAYSFTMVQFSLLVLFLAAVDTRLYVILVFVGMYLLNVGIFAGLLSRYHKSM